MDSSPGPNPFSKASLTIAVCDMISMLGLSACVGSIAKNTMLPVAAAGAIRNFTKVAPPPRVCTETVTSSSTT